MSDDVLVKPPFLSKTILLNVLISLAGVLSMLGILPQVKVFIDGHADLILAGLGAVGVLLRLVTKGKISLES